MQLPHLPQFFTWELSRECVPIRLTGEWGNVRHVDLLMVLNDAATVLATNFASKPSHVTVSPSEGPPMALFGSQPTILLNARGRHWCQYAYQFGHELCHVLTNHNRLQATPSGHFQIDEIICETAAIFTVFKLAQKWATNAPYPNWISYAAEFDKYGRNILDGYATKPSVIYPDPQNNAVDRAKNGYVARKLLPLFLRHPEFWEATQSLPLPTPTVAEFLEKWRRESPEQKAADAIATVLGAEI